MKIIILTIIFVLTSCRDNSTLPKDIDNRIFGQWTISPHFHGKVFKMYKFDTITHDKSYIFRFDRPKEFYWGYVNKTEHTNYLSCGNTLRPSSESTWSFDENSIIFDKKWTSIQESKREKTKYFIYEFSPDTFTLILDKTLLTEHKTGFD